MNLASRGLRDLDAGAQPIADAAELARVRAQARKVLIESVVLGVVLTALGLLLPRL